MSVAGASSRSVRGFAVCLRRSRAVSWLPGLESPRLCGVGLDRFSDMRQAPDVFWRGISESFFGRGEEGVR